MEVTNNSPAKLVLNGEVKQFSLNSKETKEFELLETKAHEGRTRSGAISLDGEHAPVREEPNPDCDALKKQATGWASLPGGNC